MKVVAYMVIGIIELMIMIGWAFIVNGSVTAMVGAIAIAEVFSLIVMRISQYKEEAEWIKCS